MALNLCIGNIGIRLTAGSGIDQLLIGRDFRPFVAPTACDSGIVVHHRLELPRASDQRKLCTSAGWQIYQRGSRLVIHTPLGERTEDAAIVCTEDFADGQIYLSQGCTRFGCLPTPLSRLLLIGLLSQGRGLMCHGAGIVADGTGHLFLGTDGVGKTTMARLWLANRQAQVIGDDHIILRWIGGQLWMFGTPWGAIKPTRQSAVVDRVYILQQGTADRIGDVPPHRAGPPILRRSFPPLWSAEGMAYTLAFLDKLCTTTPVFDLAFVPGPAAIETAECDAVVETTARPATESSSEHR